MKSINWIVWAAYIGFAVSGWLLFVTDVNDGILNTLTFIFAFIGVVSNASAITLQWVIFMTDRINKKLEDSLYVDSNFVTALDDDNNY